jgi:hypothetical protein
VQEVSVNNSHPGQVHLFERLRDESREDRSVAIDKLSEVEFENLLLDMAAKGIYDRRWLIPADFAGQWNEDGRMWWIVHCHGHAYQIKVERLPDHSPGGEK